MMVLSDVMVMLLRKMVSVVLGDYSRCDEVHCGVDDEDQGVDDSNDDGDSDGDDDGGVVSVTVMVLIVLELTGDNAVSDEDEGGGGVVVTMSMLACNDDDVCWC